MAIMIEITSVLGRKMPLIRSVYKLFPETVYLLPYMTKAILQVLMKEGPMN